MKSCRTRRVTPAESLWVKETAGWRCPRMEVNQDVNVVSAAVGEVEEEDKDGDAEGITKSVSRESGEGTSRPEAGFRTKSR